jgi:hypothetical protein
MGSGEGKPPPNKDEESLKFLTLLPIG